MTQIEPTEDDIAAWNPRAHYPKPADSDVAGVMAAVKYALDGVIAAFPSYRARNGKSVSLQADDGEKCWIIHDDVRNDAIHAQAALAAIPTPDLTRELADTKAMLADAVSTMALAKTRMEAFARDNIGIRHGACPKYGAQELHQQIRKIDKSLAKQEPNHE